MELNEPRRAHRRALLSGAAWSVPVVAMATAAPALAVSGCGPQKVNWDNYANGQKFNNNDRISVGSTVVTIGNTGDIGAANNATVTSTVTGGDSNVLRFYDPNTTSSSQTVTFSFSQNVKSLSFAILDVDISTNSWGDQIVVNTSGFSYTLASGTQVTGTGTKSKPFTGTTLTGVAGTSTAGNVYLSWTGPLSQVSFTYQQYNGTVNGSPFVGVSDITFTPTVQC